jgi:hypothetical protein
MSKPIVLHCGNDVKWNHGLYKKLSEVFEIKRSYSMSRQEFIEALKTKKFGDFYAIYRPFYDTGGEMGRWDAELMYAITAGAPLDPIILRHSQRLASIVL